MITLLIVVAYVTGWTALAVLASRKIAEHVPSCMNRERYSSFDSCAQTHIGPMGHYRGDGTVGRRELSVGCLVALVWPVLFLPAGVYVLATRKPTAKANALRVAELERELGYRRG